MLSKKLVSALLFVPSICFAEQMVLQPGPIDGKDTYYGTVYGKDGNPDNPELDHGGWGDAYYDFIEFELTGAPTADTVQSVTLYLYAKATRPNDPQIDVHRITEYWEEGSVSLYSNPASVNYKRMDRVVEGWNSVDITDLYKGWQNGTYQNYGIKLSPNYTWESNGAFVSSDDTVNPERRPKLVIEYQSLDPSKVKLMVDVQGIGSGQGRVVSKDMEIDCSPICEAILDQSTRVSLSAYPNPGSIFAGWSVTGCGSDKPCDFKVEESRTVTATFIEVPALYTNNKVIYVGVCGAGDVIENTNACHIGFGWYDPRYRSEFDPFNALNDQDLETVGLAYSGLDAIGLRLAALHPNSVTMVTGFSAASVYGDYNPFFIRNNVPSIVDFVSSQYQDGDTVVLVGHSAGGAIVQEAAYKLGNKKIPVALTAQIDSVGFDAKISKNVQHALNYFYPKSIFDFNCFVEGENEIYAAKNSNTLVNNEAIDTPRGPNDLTSNCGGHRNMDNEPDVWWPILNEIISISAQGSAD